MQEVSTKPLSVDEIINLATAYHYFVWPGDRKFYEERDVDFRDGSASGGKLSHAIYYAEQLKLTQSQRSIFIVQVARLTNPTSILNNGGYWDIQHERYAEVYESELLASGHDCGSAVD